MDEHPKFKVYVARSERPQIGFGVKSLRVGHHSAV
jgi:hypothetical protein